LKTLEKFSAIVVRVCLIEQANILYILALGQKGGQIVVETLNVFDASYGQDQEPGMRQQGVQHHLEVLEVRTVVEVLEKVEYFFGYAQVLERHLAEYSVVHGPLVPVVLPHHRRVV
jgi:hypothetical protein